MSAVIMGDPVKFEESTEHVRVEATGEYVAIETGRDDELYLDVDEAQALAEILLRAVAHVRLKKRASDARCT
jgi:hypothetical protein